MTAFKKQDDHIDIKAGKSPDDIDVFITVRFALLFIQLIQILLS